ncbi:hypothetical protein GCM10027068_46260 [Prescottella soli]
MTGSELLARILSWQDTGDAVVPYRRSIRGRDLRIRLGDFPAEALYTLLDGDEPIEEFDDWPECWQRPTRS